VHVTEIVLEWEPRDDVPGVMLSTQKSIDDLQLCHPRSTMLSSTSCRLVARVDGDELSVHAAVEEARDALARFATNGIIRWLQPKEET
jgi:hypothetical protein